MALISYAQRIADHAARDPEHLAVTDEHRTVTRGELERLANRIARELAARGVETGDFVTIALPNSRRVHRDGRRVLEARRDAPTGVVAACRSASSMRSSSSPIRA